MRLSNNFMNDSYPVIQRPGQVVDAEKLVLGRYLLCNVFPVGCAEGHIQARPVEVVNVDLVNRNFTVRTSLEDSLRQINMADAGIGHNPVEGRRPLYWLVPDARVR